jgi:hypothetical protein
MQWFAYALLSIASSVSASPHLLMSYSRQSLVQLLNDLDLRHATTSPDSSPLTITVKITDLTANILEIGQVIDDFITPHPWWFVVTEPYLWQSKSHPPPDFYEITLQHVPDHVTPFMKELASVQFPTDCTQYPLRIGLTGGFDSFGNNFYNYNILHSSSRHSVIVPYIIDEHSSGTSFLSKDSCPLISNKFECAFLSPTTCSVPPSEAILKNQAFDQATASANPLSTQEFDELQKKIKAHDNYRQHSAAPSTRIPPSSYQVYSNLFQSHGPQSSTRSYDLMSSLFTYGILFRLNYSFRSQIFEEISKLKASFHTNSAAAAGGAGAGGGGGAGEFPSDGDCVVVHIRRNKDRAPYELRGQKIVDWCEKYKIQPNGTCFDDETQSYIAKGDCVHYYDYGCHTRSPYGLLTLENYLNATDLIFESRKGKDKDKRRKNIILRTDDDHLVHEELSKYQGDKHIFYYPAHHNHRVASTSAGVSYLSAIELGRECRGGFVGHSGSAVTNLWLSNFCIRHYGSYGTCPTFFDFAS